MRKVVPIKVPGAAGDTIEVETITADEADLAQVTLEEFPDPGVRRKESNIRLVHASIAAAGGKMTRDDVRKLPFFGAFQPLQTAALEVNGFTETSGEAEDKGDPAPASGKAPEPGTEPSA